MGAGNGYCVIMSVIQTVMTLYDTVPRPFYLASTAFLFHGETRERSAMSTSTLGGPKNKVTKFRNLHNFKTLSLAHSAVYLAMT